MTFIAQHDAIIDRLAEISADRVVRLYHDPSAVIFLNDSDLEVARNTYRDAVDGPALRAKLAVYDEYSRRPIPVTPNGEHPVVGHTNGLSINGDILTRTDGTRVRIRHGHLYAADALGDGYDSAGRTVAMMDDGTILVTPTDGHMNTAASQFNAGTGAYHAALHADTRTTA